MEESTEEGGAATRRFLARHKEHWMKPESRSATIFSVFLFLASVVFVYWAEGFATKQAGNAVEDIILSHIPAYDLEWIYMWGAISFIAFAVVLLILKPNRMPFVIHSFTLFYFIRALFIMMTHLGVPLPPPADVGAIVGRMFFGGGLFFSGHTGAPFLMALLFWKDKRLRIIFIALSILLATSALLGHYHYTIDVVSAYFITYSIFHIAQRLFKKDYALFNTESSGKVPSAESAS